MSRARLIFLNRFFHPDHSATAQLLSDLAFELAGRGWEVEVITSRGGYDGRAGRSPACETFRGVRIHRVWMTNFGRMTIAGRVLDYLSFYLSAFAALLRRGRSGDVIVAKTDPPLLSILAAVAARIRGARLVNWLQDLYPEVAVALDVPFVTGVPAGLLRHLRNRSLRGAAMNVAIGDRMARRLADEDVREDRIAVLHNWTDDEVIRPAADAGVALRTAWGIGEGDFVIGYSGNLGRAHDADTVFEAARILRGDARFRFLFIGGGSGIGRLAERVAAAGLTNFLFKPYQPKDALSQSLAVADVHWVSLRPELEGLIVPSKCYGIAAAARPLLFVGSSDGEVANLAREYRCGFAVAQGQSDRLAQIIRTLADDPDHCRRLGAAAREMIERNFTRRQALDRWHGLFESLAASPSR